MRSGEKNDSSPRPPMGASNLKKPGNAKTDHMAHVIYRISQGILIVLAMLLAYALFIFQLGGITTNEDLMMLAIAQRCAAARLRSGASTPPEAAVVRQVTGKIPR